MLAAVIAYAAAGRAAKEARIGVRQEQWWDRARWALDLTLSDEEVNRTAGLEALGALGKSSQWTDEHETDSSRRSSTALLSGGSTSRTLVRLPLLVDNRSPTVEEMMSKQPRRPLSPSPRLGHAVSRREAAAAARARVAIDARTGQETEPWVVELAQER